MGKVWRMTVPGLLCAAAAGCLFACSSETVGSNRRPVANAGLDQKAKAGQSVLLDGSGSFDPDGEIKDYDWQLVAGPLGYQANLSDSGRVKTELKPDRAGIWVVRLSVSDGELASEPDVAEVTVEPGCPKDDDGDRYPAAECPGGNDCDDKNALVNPGVAEVGPDDPLCRDGVDNDCDGKTDQFDPGCVRCSGADDCNDDNPCTRDSCVNNLCQNIPVADDTVCDDGLFCTASSGCVSGSCTGKARDCSDANPCTVDVCDEVQDQCLHNLAPKPGAEGPSGSPTCRNGVDDDCDGLTDDEDNDCSSECLLPSHCNDNNLCTTDNCVGGECRFVSVADEINCDDGDPCTSGDACSLGVCKGTALDADGDGFVSVACGGADCDDDAAACGAKCYPGSLEVCDGFDNDCDGKTDENDSYPNWWNTKWHSRKMLTFDNSGQAEALADFPVLVVLGATSFDYSKAKVDGTDLRFIAADGKTELKYHFEDWIGGGSSQVWVKVPSIAASSSMDHIWMYYNNPSAPDVRDPGGTYDAGFVGVWHLNEPVVDEQTNGTHTDSTAKKNNGTQNLNEMAAAKISGGQSFDGTDDYVSVPHDASLNLVNNWTIETWVNAGRFFIRDNGWQAMISKDCDSDADQNHRAASLWLWRDQVEVWYTPGAMQLRSISSLSLGSWYYLAATFQGGDLRLFINGVQDNSAVAGPPDTNGYNLHFAQRGVHSGSLWWLAGGLDEVRISNRARSVAWVRAQYLSMDNRFITFGGVEEVCP